MDNQQESRASWAPGTVVECDQSQLVVLGDDGIRRRVDFDAGEWAAALRPGQRVETTQEGGGGGVRLVRTPLVVHHHP